MILPQKTEFKLTTIFSSTCTCADVFPRCSMDQLLQIQKKSLDEKSNLHKVCLVQTCCRYQFCKGLHPLQTWWLPSLHILCKLGNHHFCNGCKPMQTRYLQQVCTRQTLCKLKFSDSNHSMQMCNLYVVIKHLATCLLRSDHKYLYIRVSCIQKRTLPNSISNQRRYLIFVHEIVH